MVRHDRLIRLAEFLEGLPDQLFDYATFTNVRGKHPLEALKQGGGCGTTACAAGWTPSVFPDLLEFVPHNEYGDRNQLIPRFKGSTSNAAWDTMARPFDTWDTMARLFDISTHDAKHLFHPDVAGLGWKATAKQVADHIRKFSTRRQEQEREEQEVAIRIKAKEEARAEYQAHIIQERERIEREVADRLGKHKAEAVAA